MLSASLTSLALWTLTTTNIRRLARIFAVVQTDTEADTTPPEAVDARPATSARVFFARTAAVSAVAETLSPAAYNFAFTRKEGNSDAGKQKK